MKAEIGQCQDVKLVINRIRGEKINLLRERAWLFERFKSKKGTNLQHE